MNKIIISTTLPQGKKVALDSRKGNQIENEQCFLFTEMNRKECEEYATKYPAVTFVRHEIAPIYNCHGLTFGSRRTTIWEREAIKQILNEDDYIEISRSDVQPGDVMMYVDGKNGDFTHSGIVINEIQTFEGVPDSGKSLVLISKWGKYKEVIHVETYCPYSPLGAKFYRIKGKE